jgi:hypothetical protein
MTRQDSSESVIGGGGGLGRPVSPMPSKVVSIPPIGGSLGGVPAGSGVGGGDGPPKIRAFENKLGNAKHEDKWNRSPNVTGQGAIHVRSFHCKLSDDSLGYLDQQVNEWLDAHPQYEVKFVSTSIGEWAGKLGKEPHIVVQVWV